MMGDLFRLYDTDKSQAFDPLPAFTRPVTRSFARFMHSFHLQALEPSEIVSLLRDFFKESERKVLQTSSPTTP